MKKKKVKIKKKIDEKDNKKIAFIVFFALLLISLLIVGGYFLYLNINGESKYLNIILNGEKEVSIEYGEEYQDKGVVASYKNSDISKDVKTSNNLDLEKVGSYKYTYKINYKKQEKEIIRKVNVVDTKKPELTLNGDKEVTLYVGDTYKESFAKANDNYDGDISENVVITGNVDTGKVGEYTIVYTINDSSLNEVSIERKVKVVEKPTISTGASKIAVLNYHFFYETDEENEVLCEKQVICERMDTFRKQLQYLKDNNYKTLTMKEFVSWMYGEIELPKKSVLITIDDGGLGTGKHNGNHLIPALEEYQMHATLFLITGWWDIENYRSEYLDVESHTHNLHTSGGCNATCIGYDGLMNDLKQSIEVTKSTNAFCFPFYSYSDTAIKAVKDSGFKVAFIGGNRKASRNDNKYKIPRYPIHDSHTMEEFIKMVN